MNKANKSIMLVAGEASGDQRGAEVATALLQAAPNSTLFGIGGECMRTAGVDTLVDVNELAVMGFVEVLKHLPHILKIFKQAKNLLAERKPDLLLLIDYPGFNLRLAKAAKQLNIPVLFYVSPQVWAWRQGRVKKIANVVDHLAVLFSFEKQYYADQDIEVTHVGHPLTQKLKTVVSAENARSNLSLQPDDQVITLLPGSRVNEIERLLPIMLEAATKLKQHYPNLIFFLPIAKTIERQQIEKFTQTQSYKIHLTIDAYSVIRAANLVLTASGTATLEIALLNKPMVVIYKVSKLTAAIIGRLLKIPYISLCNIVAGEKIVSELLQQEATADNIVNESLLILNNEKYRKTMENKLQTINEKLGDTDAASNVAHIALQMLTK